MKTFVLTFEADNDAFEPHPESEIARILREVAIRVDRGGDMHGVVHDVNGNTVGRFYVDSD